jgi:hypothetical protein
MLLFADSEFTQNIDQTEEIAEHRLGILSPESQKAREIEAIKRALFEQYGEALNISDIQKENDSYLVTTAEWTMIVKVVYLPPSNPHLIGEPKRFVLTFEEPSFFLR